ncbi:MAG: tetratricopeptide repeat protein [Bryobacteraceae bacterium]|nr:tetratricopeptide repeat protein [Bryobacteraceae bacterium]
MLKRSVYWLLMILAVAGAGCSRDPETVKRKYVENGDRFLAQGKYRQASIMYRNAIKRDPKFGDAYLKLGDSELRRGDVRQAVGAYRRAVELLPETDEPAGKLADIYLAAYAIGRQQNPVLLNEVRDLAEALSSKDQNSYHALRLQGFLMVADNRLKEALDYFLRADRIQPKQPELRYAIAQVYLQDGNWDEAERIAREMLSDSPGYIQTYEFLSAQYFLRKRNEDALGVLKSLVANHPRNTRYRARLAALHYVLQQRDEALRILDDLLAKESEFADARMEVGDFYTRIRDFERALQVYGGGVEKNDARKTDYRLKRVLAFVAQNRFDQAMNEVELALKEDPQNNDAVSLRASLQLNSGDRESTATAIADLQTLIGREPRNPVIRYNLARAHQSRGEIDAARVQFAEAVKIRADFVAAHVGLGQINLLKRDYGAAIESAEKALQLEPGNIPAKVVKINALINNDNLRQARSDLETYLRQAPESPDLQFQLALVNFQEQRFAEAENSFRALRTRFPSDPRLTFGIAEVYMRTGRQKEALEFIQQELQKTPEDPGLQGAIANIARRADDLPLAERYYRQLLEKNPKSQDLHLQLGEVLRRRGQMQASIELLRRGLQLDNNSPSANLQLAMTLDAAGLKRESLPLYEAIVKIQPDNAIALNNLAFMLAEDGRDLDQALTYAQRARQLMPNNPDVADTLGWIYIRKNLSDNAIRIFRELTAKHGNIAMYHYHLGMALHQKGDRAGARQSLQTALSLRPGKEDEVKIRELLARVG